MSGRVVLRVTYNSCRGNNINTIMNIRVSGFRFFFSSLFYCFLSCVVYVWFIIYLLCFSGLLKLFLFHVIISQISRNPFSLLSLSSLFSLLSLYNLKLFERCNHCCHYFNFIIVVLGRLIIKMFVSSSCSCLSYII